MTTDLRPAFNAPRTPKLELARELVDDIEHHVGAMRGILLKTSRLATLMGDETTRRWLEYELGGYPAKGGSVPEIVEQLDFLAKTGRMPADGAVVRDAVTVIEKRIPSLRAGAEVAYAQLRTRGTLQDAKHHEDAQAAVSQSEAVLERVRHALHEYATLTCYVLEFGEVAESMFARHSALVDMLLGDSAWEVLKKIPAIYERLQAGDEEAIGVGSLNSVALFL